MSTVQAPHWPWSQPFLFPVRPAYSRRAFDLRDRVSERERFFISWRYYVDAEQVKQTITLIRGHQPLPATSRVPSPDQLLHVEPLRRLTTPTAR